MRPWKTRSRGTTMTKLANFKIGKKLGLLIGATVLQLVCLTGVALWGIHGLDRGMGALVTEVHRKALALTIASDVNGIAVYVSNAILYRGVTDEAQARIAQLRKRYMDAFDELGTLNNSPQDHDLRGKLEQAGTGWREENTRVLDLTKAGKHAEANTTTAGIASTL